MGLGWRWHCRGSPCWFSSITTLTPWVRQPLLSLYQLPIMVTPMVHSGNMEIIKRRHCRPTERQWEMLYKKCLKLRGFYYWAGPWAICPGFSFWWPNRVSIISWALCVMCQVCGWGVLRTSEYSVCVKSLMEIKHYLLTDFFFYKWSHGAVV